MSLGGYIVIYNYNSNRYKGRVQDKVKTTSITNSGMEKRRTDVQDHFIIEMMEAYDHNNDIYLSNEGRHLHVVLPEDIKTIVT